ncbi:MAG: hypothetical protein J2P39_06740, partial [Candidatus Dormibacteraeota bacterium]|nr:hypothetical protein [Candidatus Dormibacteraeota bacterium]
MTRTAIASRYASPPTHAVILWRVKLADLAAGVRGARVLAGPSRDVERIVLDSRQAGPGDLFVAVRGHHVDGHRFVPLALAQGSAVAVEDA